MLVEPTFGQILIKCVFLKHYCTVRNLSTFGLPHCSSPAPHPDSPPNDTNNGSPPTLGDGGGGLPEGGGGKKASIRYSRVSEHLDIWRYFSPGHILVHWTIHNDMSVTLPQIRPAIVPTGLACGSRQKREITRQYMCTCLRLFPNERGVHCGT